MATKLDKTFDIAAAPDAVLNAMRNPELIRSSELSRGARSVDIDERIKTEARHEYEVRVVSPKRTVKGVDPSKTEENRTTVAWDLAACKGRWTWQGEHGPRVKVSGAYTITPSGSGAKLRLEAEVDINIPVVGGMIERKVREGFEQGWVDYVARIRAMVA